MKGFRAIAITVAILLALFCLLIVDEFRVVRIITPSEKERDLLAFLESRTDLKKIRHFNFQEKEYLEIRSGRPFSLLSLPSGPPAYIFDRQGKLVEWSKDIGDDSKFQRRWNVPTNAPSLTVEEAKAWVKVP